MRTLDEINTAIEKAQSTNADWQSVIKPLYDERSQIIKQNRDKWDDENYCVLIDCPAHLSHKVKLFTYGHHCAGIWECEIEDISDSCPHYDIETEVTEDYDGAPDKINICSLCHVALEGDPYLEEQID
jgi:hypothetical protein